MNTRRHWSLAAGITGMLLLSCRDGVPPFTAPGLEYAERITFGVGDDRDPQWLSGGDSLVYHTDAYDALPGGGVLLRIPADGGTALPLLDVQRTTNRVFATPVVSPDGERVAFIDLVRLDIAAPCLDDAGFPSSRFCGLTQPVLDSAALRVRSRDADQPITADPAIGIALAGVDPAFRTVSSDVYVQQALPFQQQYRQTGAVLLRPSWAPDNQRIVFSNGSRLFIWRVGDATATAIPNTDDAVSPAWSPNGELIAFTQLLRTDSTQVDCTCAQPGSGAFATHRRMLYEVAAPRLVLIRPDGTGRTELGEGADAAWSRDAQSLYVVRDNEIVRINTQGAAAATIPNTLGARYPAVSPDGRRLAFAKPLLREDYDIWVVALQQ